MHGIGPFGHTQGTYSPKTHRPVLGWSIMVALNLRQILLLVCWTELFGAASGWSASPVLTSILVHEVSQPTHTHRMWSMSAVQNDQSEAPRAASRKLGSDSKTEPSAKSAPLGSLSSASIPCGRPFDSEGDYTSMLKMCTSWDYLPTSIESFCCSAIDHPSVLSRDGKAVAFGNLQMMSTSAGWVQAIRTDPEEQGKGLGTMITKYFEEVCSSLGGSMMLSSTHPTNKAMLRVFAKTGWTQTAEYGWFFCDSVSDEASGTPETGVDLLRGIGAEECLENIDLVKLARCESIAEIKHILASVQAEAEQEWGTKHSAVWAPSVYRIYDVEQATILDALRDGRAWGHAGPGAALVLQIWSPEAEALVWSVTSACSLAFQGAVGFAASNAPAGPLRICYSDFGAEWREASLSPAMSEHATTWPLFSKSLRAQSERTERARHAQEATALGNARS